ncbi:MAG: hypothetical protein HKM06_07005 [Spirochaetales bacterium]|nr:hypothetical protein [Spirochaetales bacterium]
MLQKINRITETLVEGLASLPNIEAIQKIPYRTYKNEASPLDCLKVDVFSQGSVPDAAARVQGLPHLEFLETSPGKNKDRFFLDGMAVHIEYKRVEDIEELLARLHTSPYRLTEDSTYGLFRLRHGIPVMKKTEWIEHQKKLLENLPEPFWQAARQNLKSRMEHQVADLGSALYNQDSFHFQTSLAHYLETISELLFVANEEFLCPPEQIRVSLEELKILPSGFEGLFDTLIRADVDQERKLSVARRLAELLLAF